MDMNCVALGVSLMNYAVVVSNSIAFGVWDVSGQHIMGVWGAVFRGFEEP